MRGEGGMCVEAMEAMKAVEAVEAAVAVEVMDVVEAAVVGRTTFAADTRRRPISWSPASLEADTEAVRAWMSARCSAQMVRCHRHSAAVSLACRGRHRAARIHGACAVSLASRGHRRWVGLRAELWGWAVGLGGGSGGGAEMELGRRSCLQ